MNKSLKHNDVIELISEKIALKRELRTLPKDDKKSLDRCQKRINKIEKTLQSKPLQKS
jgi:hypothetical protein